jgi:putative PLP-dependent aminotransferase (TIGR04422 family)
MTDYQWPRPQSDLPPFEWDSDDGERRDAITAVESFFRERLGADAIFVPSGRAAISMVLEAHGIGRGDVVFAPKWSSTCIWDAIRRRANPTVSLTDDCDCVLAVHKWGRTYSVTDESSSLVIEDSVDSLFTNDATLFPNDGCCEIISLPKVIGSYGGGIVMTADAALADSLREQQGRNPDFGRRQSHLRYRAATRDSTGLDAWTFKETENRYVDVNLARHVRRCLDNYQRNHDIIERRLAHVESHAQLSTPSVSDGRLPPVLAFEREQHPSALPESLMVRHDNRAFELDDPTYREVYLLPLHFGVSDDEFERLLGALVGTETE